MVRPISPFFGLLCTAEVHIPDGDRHTVFGELQPGCPADAGAATGNRRYFDIECHISSHPSHCDGHVRISSPDADVYFDLVTLDLDCLMVAITCRVSLSA
jgi:hypothetical protein